MILAFFLSMPNVGSWNGKWTGEGKKYVIVHTLRSKSDKESATKMNLPGRYFHFNFGDGWAAGVTVKQVDGREARQLRRTSDGFCCYDWMVDSILKHGEIRTGTIS